MKFRRKCPSSHTLLQVVQAGIDILVHKVAGHREVEVAHLESHQVEDLETSPVHTGVDHKEVVLQDKEPADILPEDHRNPADSSKGADRFDTGRMLAPESGMNREACHRSFLGAEHFGTRSWESGVAYLGNQALEKMSCKK